MVVVVVAPPQTTARSATPLHSIPSPRLAEALVPATTAVAALVAPAAPARPVFAFKAEMGREGVAVTVRVLAATASSEGRGKGRMVERAHQEKPTPEAAVAAVALEPLAAQAVRLENTPSSASQVPQLATPSLSEPQRLVEPRAAKLAAREAPVSSL